MIFGRKREAEPEVGYDVVTNDEEHLGGVTAVHDDVIEVTGGTIDHHIIFRVPREAVARVNEQTVHLSVSRGQARAKGWDQMAGSGQPEASSSSL